MRLDFLRRPLALIMLALMLSLSWTAQPSFAVEPDEVLADRALETRARKLSAELRCLVCQNQSIDDSNAPLARDLRLLVRERLSKGDSDEQVRNFVVARYGTYVLLKPPLDAGTVLLWATPLLLLLGIGLLVMRQMRQSESRAATSPSAPLSAEEREKLAAILAKDQAATGRPD